MEYPRKYHSLTPSQNYRNRTAQETAQKSHFHISLPLLLLQSLETRIVFYIEAIPALKTHPKYAKI